MASKIVTTAHGDVEVRREGHAVERTVWKDGVQIGRVVKRHGERAVATYQGAVKGVLTRSINAGVFYLATVHHMRQTDAAKK